MAEKFEDDPGYIYLQVTREDKAKSLSRTYDSKKNCWVPDPEEGNDC
jgi:myosin protein heavy chain